MGQFLHLGLCTKAYITETDKIKKYYEKDSEFIEDFQKQTNLKLNLYNFEEIDSNYLFKIKDELLVAKSCRKNLYGVL